LQVARARGVPSTAVLWPSSAEDLTGTDGVPVYVDYSVFEHPEHAGLLAAFTARADATEARRLDAVRLARRRGKELN